MSKTLFEHALAVGRPPNITRLFPNSRALLVSGKVVDRALGAKGKAMTMAANGRNALVIRGALAAAQRADSCLILEIAKSEGGRNAYCAVNYWNLARMVDAFMNELNITVPVAIHADHYGVKNNADLEAARVEIPSMFDAGITSIAIDASHQPDADNLLACIDLHRYVPSWAGLETEVGEIKGTLGLSTVEEALFLIRGLNAHAVFPDWIALNNGTTHGIEAGSLGIQVELTREVHEALAPYGVSGAQHGTSGNSSERLRRIAMETRTTKANVATALQVLSWGVAVNDYGNAELDDNGNFVKVPGEGMTEELWGAMTACAAKQGLSSGNYKKLNLSFDNHILSQPCQVRERMAKRVEEFVFHMLTEVMYAKGTAPLALEILADSGSYDVGAKAARTEDLAQWTEEKMREKAAALGSDQGPDGDFDD